MRIGVPLEKTLCVVIDVGGGVVTGGGSLETDGELESNGGVSGSTGSPSSTLITGDDGLVTPLIGATASPAANGIESSATTSVHGEAGRLIIFSYSIVYVNKVL